MRPAVITTNFVSQVNRISYVAKIAHCIRSLEYQGLKERLQVIVASALHRDAFLKLTRPDPGSAFERLMTERPRYTSLLTSPYIDARWSSSERVNRLADHVSTLQGQLSKYDFPVSQSLHVLDLGEFSIPDYYIVFDKPIWFCYEGLITINLLKGNFRFFSITFSFYSEAADTGMIIGGVQGRKSETILAQYREFTKLTYGQRPRDFLLEILRIIARTENIKHVLGIPDRFRYHRHRYFAKSKSEELHLDYDDIWKDRGGVLTKDGVYELPLASDRHLDRISARKRSMYRHRYALLDQIEAKIAAVLPVVQPAACGRID